MVESKDSEESEGDATVHDHEHDDWYGYNVNEEKCIVEEAFLEESQDEIKHEVPPPHSELVQFMAANTVNLIPASLTCSQPSPSPLHRFLRPLDSLGVMALMWIRTSSVTCLTCLRGMGFMIIGP